MPAVRHPFPPLVRWLVAPTFAIATGAGAGFTLSAWGAYSGLGHVLGAAFSAAAAFGFAVTARRAPSVLLSVALAYPALAALLALRFQAGRAGAAWSELVRLSTTPALLPVIGTAVAGMALAWQACSSRGRHRLAWGLGVSAGSGVVWTQIAAWTSGHTNSPPLWTFGTMLALSQLVPMAASCALAERLDRSVPRVG